eukprot:CAMPEP_0197689274 /NCGR_PEP_ID=MMETSP1338-20131121/106606_1 /TAXON_ID=43686 ORGANISM="Pelagodinium beii, Strain RCC1491" /NCGR_SAMPLE_ID=MMETSP1338 /ASSEMBLY_ACC=CAM_ASM_000754 /LENGTH=342 /DNA_ID=CAMNT_0043271593 /DNA_START=18 /DNA_END=1046 /DNA_ORIENTATION=-
MAGYPSRPPSRGIEAEEGPLWNTIKRQLYKPEVTLIKRLVGEQLIQQNKLMWEEIASLRQMLSDYQDQNDEFSQGRKRLDFCDTQHRDLLRRQAQIILDDLRSQAEACGHMLEDMVPELRDQKLQEFVFVKKASDLVKLSELQPPATPSTRPSTASGYSNSCSTSDLTQNLSGMSSLPMGRQLGIDDMDEVAAGIREALEAEQQSLLATIAEEMQRLEAEDVRRANMERGGTHGEPSTAELQKFLHKLQDLVVSPGLRTLSLTAPTAALEPRPISGGANVRRLQALISQRRFTGSGQSLNVVPEAPSSPKATDFGTPKSFLIKSGSSGPVAFDPFFDDPFAA